jgi:hypothetical protein
MPMPSQLTSLIGAFNFSWNMSLILACSSLMQLQFIWIPFHVIYWGFHHVPHGHVKAHACRKDGGLKAEVLFAHGILRYQYSGLSAGRAAHYWVPL